MIKSLMTPADYLSMFNCCSVTEEPRFLREIDSVCHVMLVHQDIYLTVQRFVSIPWPLIGVIHFRESNQYFTRHLHNGDPLTDRTVHVPEGRPQMGQPPYTWIESAADALSNTWRPNAWDIPGCLEYLERYNGLGYQKRSVNSPYLWGYTDKYVSGLYTSDGVFDPHKVESRPGCVALIKTLIVKGVSFDFSHIAGNDNSLH